MELHVVAARSAVRRQELKCGPVGRLSIFLWSLGMVMLSPAPRLPLAAGLCLAAAALLAPASLRRILRARFAFMLALLVLPPLFFLGEADRTFGGVAYSAEGALAALQIALRFVVVLVAVDTFTQSVDIVQIAGLLERLGLRGLGFSLGVALNLLPGLQQSAVHGWQSLRMRGGLRRKRWRGLRLLAVTIVTNALRRAEDIALAAEARAFSPERCRPAPLEMSLLDRLLPPGCILLLLALILLP